MSERVAREVDVPDDRPEIRIPFALDDKIWTARVKMMDDVRDLAPYYDTSNRKPSPAEIDSRKMVDLVDDWLISPDFSRGELEQLPFSVLEQFISHITPDPPARGLL